jgi:hypothetical protein
MLSKDGVPYFYILRKQFVDSNEVLEWRENAHAAQHQTFV